MIVGVFLLPLIYDCDKRNNSLALDVGHLLRERVFGVASGVAVVSAGRELGAVAGRLLRIGREGRVGRRRRAQVLRRQEQVPPVRLRRVLPRQRRQDSRARYERARPDPQCTQFA